MNLLQNQQPTKHITKFARTALAETGAFLCQGGMSKMSADPTLEPCEPCCGLPGQIGCKLEALYFQFTHSDLAIDPLHEARMSSSIEEFRNNGFDCQHEEMQSPVSSKEDEDMTSSSCHMDKPNSLANYQQKNSSSTEQQPTLNDSTTQNVAGILLNGNYSNNNDNHMETYFALRGEPSSKVVPPQCYMDNYDHVLESSSLTLKELNLSSCSSTSSSVNNNQNGTSLSSNPLETYMAFKELRKKKKPPKVEHCVFCKNNGEDVLLYTSHVLKDETGRVSCPVLRNYTCPLCGSNGDNAHTVRYCPLGSSTPPPWSNNNNNDNIKNNVCMDSTMCMDLNGQQHLYQVQVQMQPPRQGQMQPPQQGCCLSLETGNMCNISPIYNDNNGLMTSINPPDFFQLKWKRMSISQYQRLIDHRICKTPTS